MSIHGSDAFVLRTYRLAEADKICVFLTRELGKVRGVAYGAAKMKSRFGSALEPFTEVALSFHRKHGRDLVSISSCDIIRSHFRSSARDVATAAAFSYMAELLIEFLPEDEPNERVYRLVGAVLDSIDVGLDLGPALRYFELWVLRLAGFFPEILECSACGRPPDANLPVFLSPDGTPRCPACAAGRGFELDPALRQTIGRLFRVPPASFADADPAHIAAIAEVGYQLIRHVLERDLKSRSLLRQLGAL